MGAARAGRRQGGSKNRYDARYDRRCAGHYVLLLVPKASIGALTYATPEVYQAADDRSRLIAFQPGDYFCRGDHEWAEYDVLC